ncbi:MAG: tRNA (adenosine(37)-N6)-threonylcarbamoyltransferase complex transferase subunit TsaD [Candidatus Babeliaceae bacterium]|nr:tRNA (adenosine(37)-N6)-threonylcarbamoyltransferase complex transferase subunit TsaD [Candidatus Babeliaceae bacterium]
MERMVLAIESSCDETAAAVYSSTRGVLSNNLFSQINLHAQYGGVVPEIASRSHIEKINLIIEQALEVADVKLADIDTIAVTQRPGLPGSLLIGVCFAKALAGSLNKKIIGVNHLEGHAFSACIENAIPFPFICLTASGGHTALYYVKAFGDYEIIGQTTDDAAGEAFDKVAKLIGLPYPGGPEIEKLAHQVGFEDFFKYPRLKDTVSLDFSFSGLKTAVLYDLIKKNLYSLHDKKFLAHGDRELQQKVSSSLLVCIGDIFERILDRALKRYPDVTAIAFVGGVACNKYLKRRLENTATKHKKAFYFPPPKYCTDNAAMIAFVANYKAEQNNYSDLSMDIY